MTDNIFHKFNDFVWDGISKIDYKPSGDGPVTFNETTRQNLVENNLNTDFHLRYFECAIDGFSTLEKHEHVHVVMIARGKGKVIVNDKIYDAEPMDLITIPPHAFHQLINTGEEPFGFFCTVDAKRDKFNLLTQEEILSLKKNPEIANYIQVPKKYFD
ncbi:cupin domain-containing protein [Alkalibaculum sp. M08DMB]|uniref:Cupin domain-containing protein n=1 Tax=Alkalibaculum sporogenes TaxID=2655001 RepID=A0A6A7K509_9FIRM|nr:cupin domain-containing protein [Alkalibaculum sporogenes]MPW24465.1 cupin domain-containing protein [Alkalibaculum sporogenes]